MKLFLQFHILVSKVSCLIFLTSCVHIWTTRWQCFRSDSVSACRINPFRTMWRVLHFFLNIIVAVFLDGFTVSAEIIVPRIRLHLELLKFESVASKNKVAVELLLSLKISFKSPALFNNSRYSLKRQ